MRRVRIGLTQRELARRAGLSARTVRHIEQGHVRRPRTESLRRLAEVVGLDPALPRIFGHPGVARGGSLLHLGLLGRLTVAIGDRPINIGSLKQRSMLGLLALQADRVVSRDEIIDVLWDDKPPDTCAALVHSYASRLRNTLQLRARRGARGQVITATRDGYQLTLAREQLDILEFDDLISRAKSLGQDKESALELFERALRCWRGPVLANTVSRLRQHPMAIALTQRRLAAVLAYADTAIALQRYELAAEQIRTQIGEEPLHEGLHARLMVALAGSGQQAAALRLFGDIRARLADELGVDPSAELQATYLGILRRDTFVEPVTPVHSPSPVPAQLPPDIAGFTGRADSLAKLDALLIDDCGGASEVPVGLVSGMAGIGKSSLAIHWAHRIRDTFPDGQLYVNLRGHSPDPAMRPIEALDQFLRALGAGAGHKPATPEEATALYRTHLAGRKMLVVLDDAATADQVRPMLPGRPGCLVLITSRNRLTSLVAREGARTLALEALRTWESRILLENMLGADRVRAEPIAAAELVQLCSHTPLALRTAAADLASQPGLDISGYVADLRGGHRRNVLAERQTAVRAAFALSRVTQPADSRPLLRRLADAVRLELVREDVAPLPGVDTGRLDRVVDQFVHSYLLNGSIDIPAVPSVHPIDPDEDHRDLHVS